MQIYYGSYKILGAPSIEKQRQTGCGSRFTGQVNSKNLLFQSMSRSSLLQRPDRILIVGTSKKKFGGGGGEQWKPLFKLIVKGELRLCIAARLNVVIAALIIPLISCGP